MQVFILYCRTNGYTFVLYIRNKETILSEPLKQLLDDFKENIIFRFMKKQLDLEEVPYCTPKDIEILSRELKKRKLDYHKAQYLRSVACDLIKSDSSVMQKKGACILNRIIVQFTDEEYIIMTCHLILGEYYRSVLDYENAINQFEIVMNYNHSNGNYGGLGMGSPELSIALTILVLKHVEDYDYAKKLLNEVDSRTLFIKQHRELYTLMVDALNGKISPDAVCSYYKNNFSN